MEGDNEQGKTECSKQISKLCAPSELDARGLLCPMPVIRTQDAIAELKHHEVLHVIASDPGTLHDIPAWCRVHGHDVEVVTQSVDADEFRFIVTVQRN